MRHTSVTYIVILPSIYPNSYPNRISDKKKCNNFQTLLRVISILNFIVGYVMKTILFNNRIDIVT